VFSESYKDGQGSRYVKDISIRSAAYKGMISLILKNGATDFLAGKNMSSEVSFAESVEVHHIFPKKYCDARGFPKARYDSIANKTLILKGTNRIIGGDPPSIYLGRIERRTGLSSAEVDEILERHFIDAAFCRANKFEAFIVNRANKIFDAIERLTGRSVVGRDNLK